MIGSDAGLGLSERGTQVEDIDTIVLAGLTEKVI